MTAAVHHDDGEIVTPAVPVLQLARVSHRFHRTGNDDVLALDEVDLSIGEGEVLGLVGESGSGKSTLARLTLGLMRPSEGSVMFEGRDLTTLGSRGLRAIRPRVQMVFQDPYAALNPRMTIGQLVAEPLRLHTGMSRTARLARVKELLALAQLSSARLGSYPHEFSGGQLQRVNIARALATSPSLLVLDEPTASLDAHTRRAVLDLLERLRVELGLTYLLISHDLASVSRYSDRVVVLYRGRIVEEGAADVVTDRGVHPYTNKLIAARMGLGARDDERRLLWTQVGAVADEILLTRDQCTYSPRCPLSIEACLHRRPPLDRATGHPVACVRAVEIVAGTHLSPVATGDPEASGNRPTTDHPIAGKEPPDA